MVKFMVTKVLVSILIKHLALQANQKFKTKYLGVSWGAERSLESIEHSKVDFSNKNT